MQKAVVALLALLALASCGKHRHEQEKPGDKSPKKVAEEPVALMLAEGKIVLPIPLHFTQAQGTELAAECVPMLEKVEAWLRQKPDITLLRIEVHSDSDGDATAAQQLSEARALAIAKHLVALGVDCKRLLPVGFGGTKPVADATTADGKARNRRIELRPAALRGKPIGGMPVDGGGKVAGDPCAK